SRWRGYLQATRIRGVVHGQHDGFVLHPTQTQVADVDILDSPAPVTSRFDAHAALRTLELRVFHEHIAYATGHLAANHQATVPSVAFAAADDDILCWPGDSPAILVIARFQHHTVVARVEDAVFNQHVTA